jgi:hypothetical protein
VSEQLTITGDVEIARLGPAQLAVLTALRELGRLDDDEAGAIVHERRGKHSRDTRCTYCTVDGRHVLTSLRAHGLAKQRRGDGWIDPNHSTEYSQDDRHTPRARRTDPATSHAAARSVRDLRESQLAVLLTFHKHGPMHDELLVTRYDYGDAPRQSDSGLRTRRRELYDLGLLRSAGLTAKTVCGRDSAVWELTDQGRTEAERHGRVSDALDAIGF